MLEGMSAIEKNLSRGRGRGMGNLAMHYRMAQQLGGGLGTYV